MAGGKFIQNSPDAVLHFPVRKMRAQLAQVRNITDVIAGAVRIFVTVPQLQSHACQRIDGLQDRETIRPAAPQVVYFPAAWGTEELQKQMRYIVTVDLVAHLLPFVTVDGVFFAGRGAVNDVSQIAVQFDGGVLRSGQAAAAKHAYRHLKVAPEFLAHDID